MESPHPYSVTISAHDPDELKMALDVRWIAGVITDMDDRLRNISKHSDDEVEAKYAQLFRSMLWQIINANEVERYFS